ncbi:hypothetical protein PV04_09799 [Phialophora macrospora]|uniref:Uncharacterized protein n=1 Tax=Phialophora macrospora TaxID=1851006 RepID=A0A0D2CCX6_9EURO|nr:hypothetical protein PV04_09799 [Phialophora macrospora]
MDMFTDFLVETAARVATSVLYSVWARIEAHMFLGMICGCIGVSLFFPGFRDLLLQAARTADVRRTSQLLAKSLLHLLIAGFTIMSYVDVLAVHEAVQKSRQPSRGPAIGIDVDQDAALPPSNAGKHICLGVVASATAKDLRCKRARDAGGLDADPTRAKRPRPSSPLHSTPNTDSVLDQFRASSSESALPRAQFVGMCAYLYTILTWGYKISTNHIDTFITAVPLYRTFLRSPSARDTHPSYHQWFSEQTHLGHIAGSTPNVLSPARLREVARENPFDFVHAELRLEFLAAVSVEARMAEDWDAALEAEREPEAES